MARLIDCFRALFSFGLELDGSIAAGHAAPTPEAAQRRALELLDAARGAAHAAGAGALQIESASFAVIAWIDEILARNPGGAAGRAPLQLQLFNSSNAHSEFFHHLAALHADDDEVREVYWSALVHGFKGQYYFEHGDGGELGRLKDLHARRPSAGPAALDALANEQPAMPRLQQRRRKRAMLRTGVCLALLLPLLYLLWFLLGRTREAPPTLAQRVEQRLQAFACADLAAASDADGSTRVSGFVPEPADVARVAREVRSIPGVQAASFDIRLRVWPHCEVLAMLKPYQARNRDRRHGLRIAAPTAQNGRLREGDGVRVQVTNGEYAGHLRVDYYTADGAVMHLNAKEGRLRTRAGETVEFGRDIPASWLVSPPFGTVLITALSSPLAFDDATDEAPFELASGYLQRLRILLAANEASGRLIADFVFVETVAR